MPLSTHLIFLSPSLFLPILSLCLSPFLPSLSISLNIPLFSYVDYFNTPFVSPSFFISSLSLFVYLLSFPPYLSIYLFIYICSHRLPQHTFPNSRGRLPQQGRGRVTGDLKSLVASLSDHKTHASRIGHLIKTFQVMRADTWPDNSWYGRRRTTAGSLHPSASRQP